MKTQHYTTRITEREMTPAKVKFTFGGKVRYALTTDEADQIAKRLTKKGIEFTTTIIN